MNVYLSVSSVLVVVLFRPFSELKGQTEKKTAFAHTCHAPGSIESGIEKINGT